MRSAAATVARVRIDFRAWCADSGAPEPVSSPAAGQRLDGLLLQGADERVDLLLAEAALTTGSPVGLQITHI